MQTALHDYASRQKFLMLPYAKVEFWTISAEAAGCEPCETNHHLVLFAGIPEQTEVPATGAAATFLEVCRSSAPVADCMVPVVQIVALIAEAVCSVAVPLPWAAGRSCCCSRGCKSQEAAAAERGAAASEPGLASPD